MATVVPQRIDLGGLLRKRAPRLANCLTPLGIKALERLVCQRELNHVLSENAGAQGADFCRGALRTLGVEVDVTNPQALPQRSHRRVIMVSNHPLGGLDGLALTAMAQAHYGGQVWFLVNDVLMAVEPLRSVFLPVNKFGSQSRDGTRHLGGVLASDDPVLIFPAGLCSRMQKVNGSSVIEDLEWKKMFVTKALEYRRDIVPIGFSGHNRRSFYRLAQWRQRLGIRFNLEQLMLPREMVASRGKRYRIRVGRVIPWQDLATMGPPREAAGKIRGICLRLSQSQD